MNCFELKAYNFYGTLLFVDPNDPMTQQAIEIGLISLATEEFIKNYKNYLKQRVVIAKKNDEIFNKIRFQNAELN